MNILLLRTYERDCELLFFFVFKQNGEKDKRQRLPSCSQRTRLRCSTPPSPTIKAALEILLHFICDNLFHCVTIKTLKAPTQMCTVWESGIRVWVVSCIPIIECVPSDFHQRRVSQCPRRPLCPHCRKCSLSLHLFHHQARAGYQQSGFHSQQISTHHRSW